MDPKRILAKFILVSNLKIWVLHHTSSNTLFISLRLVLRGVYCMGLTPIFLVTLRLPVHD
jgi:hypothetical protein